MNSKEICVWLDERWVKALEEHSGGKHIEEIMQAHLDKLVQTLPDKVRESIAAEIKAEDEVAAAQAEADRRFSLARVTEDGKTAIHLLERGEDMLGTAQRLRRYLRGENRLPELYPAAAELTQERAEQYVAEAVNGSPRVVGVYDIDLDKGEFSSLDINYGWRVYQVREISTAVYHATKKESADWVEKRHRFYEQVESLEYSPTSRPVLIRGTAPLPVKDICFESDILEMDGGSLNFYIPVYFDPDAVFGTHVETNENDDWINVYADYDMETGRVEDTLEITLVRGDGTELCCQYRLTKEEQAALLPKMDAYCKEQLGMGLEECREQYLAEQTPQQPGQTM